MIQDPGLRARLAEALGLAQSGLCDEARATATRIISELGTAPTRERAAALYVRAIAALEAEDHLAAMLDVDRVLDIAGAIDESGWATCALALRVQGVGRRGGEHPIVADLVAAERGLVGTRSRAVRNWAECGLGWAYSTVRLYELALPHLEAATRNDHDVLAMRESSLIDWINLAEVHLRSAMELEQVDLAHYGPRIRHHLRAARDAVERARTTGRDNRVGSRWFLVCDLYALAAGRGDGLPPDVVEARRILDEADARQLPADALQAAVLLVLGHSGRGEHDAALEIVDDLPRRLDDHSLGDDLAVLAHWAGVVAAGAAGLRGAELGLRHAVATARRSHRERQASVAAIREALHAAELTEAHARDRRAARQDPLTGVANVRGLREWFAAAAADSWDVMVVGVDIDAFKVINDTHGHAAGDTALVLVADALSRCCGSNDLAARTGGDEFVIVLRDDGTRSTEAVCESVREAVSGRLRDAALDDEAAAHLADLTISVGAASSRHEDGIDALATIADQRMYVDKVRRRAPAAAVARTEPA